MNLFIDTLQDNSGIIWLLYLTKISINLEPMNLPVAIFKLSIGNNYQQAPLCVLFPTIFSLKPDLFLIWYMPEKKTKLAEIKTKPTNDNVLDFIEMIPNEQKRADSLLLLDIMKKFTSHAPILWSNSIIGFGSKRYESQASGRQVDWFIIGFAPRKTSLTIYLIDLKRHELALQRLGKYKAGGGCLHINRLSDIDLEVLQDIVVSTVNL